ncbi:MAG: citramalate synthase [Ferrimicrobium sp.]|nr:citramalate synthase [Ferrimicrobium sp.]
MARIYERLTSLRTVDIYDTTLRDGSQQEGISLTVDDKLRVARQLDSLGVHYIEGGWPGANPKDAAFFARAATELNLHTARLVAFGSTRRANADVGGDPNLQALIESGVNDVCIVAKAWDYHVVHALRTSLEEALAMVRESVGFLVQHERRVLLDAEHFFDGFKDNPAFALAVLEAGATSGATTVVLCDTNGGTLPTELGAILTKVRDQVDIELGVHFHNDSGCAVANSLIAVDHGVSQIQGCLNGYGERTGNANLVPIIAALSLKQGITTIPSENLELLTSTARHIAEITNLPVPPQTPYVGASAFTHKAGLHVSAIARRSDAYEHVNPSLVGNHTRFVVSEMAGRQTLIIKAAELGLELTDDATTSLLQRLKDLEHEGYHFEVADGSLELLMRQALGWQQSFFAVESYRVATDDYRGAEILTEATVKIQIANERVIATAEGNGPVHALDQALRQALQSTYPQLTSMGLDDYKVRVLDTSRGTDAVVRVLIDFSDPEAQWTTTGVSTNIIEASFSALTEGFVLALLKTNHT